MTWGTIAVGVGTAAYSSQQSARAADAAEAGATRGAQATKAASDENINFQKWLWGEQKSLQDPYAGMGKGAIGAYMQELGFKGTEGAPREYGVAKPISPRKEDFKGRPKAFKEVYNQFQNDLSQWEENKFSYESRDPEIDWAREGGTGGFTADDLYAEPGYKFGLREGRKAYETSGAARGMQLSGRQAKELTRFGTDYAGTKYNEAFNRRQVNLDNLYRMINTGQSAASGQAAAGSQMGAQVGASIGQAGQAQSQMYSDVGNIRASQAMSGVNTLMDIGNLAVNAGWGGSQVNTGGYRGDRSFLQPVNSNIDIGF